MRDFLTGVIRCVQVLVLALRGSVCRYHPQLRCILIGQVLLIVIAVVEASFGDGAVLARSHCSLGHELL